MKSATHTNVNLITDGALVIAHLVTTFDLTVESANSTGKAALILNCALRYGLTPHVLTGTRHGETCTLEIHAAGTPKGAAGFAIEAPFVAACRLERLPDTGTALFKLSIVAWPAVHSASAKLPAPTLLMYDILSEVATHTDAAQVRGLTFTDLELSGVELDIVFLSNRLFVANMARELRRAFAPNRIHFTIRPIGDAPPEEEVSLVPEDPKPPRSPTNGRVVHFCTGKLGPLPATRWPTHDENGVAYASTDVV